MLDFTLDDHISVDLDRLIRQISNPQGYFRIWGSKSRDQGRRNARAKGGRHFWREVSDSIQVDEVSASKAVIGVHHVAAAQKEYGGRIVARNSRALTIPIDDESRGKRAAEFGFKDLFLIKSKNDNSILGYNDNGAFKGLYLLRKAVEQQPEPFMPNDDELLRTGEQEAMKFIEKGL